MHKVARQSIKGTGYFFRIYSKSVCDTKAIDGIVMKRENFCDLISVVDFVGVTVHVPHTVVIHCVLSSGFCYATHNCI